MRYLKSEQIEINKYWFYLPESNALIVQTLKDNNVVYWKLDSQGYIQKSIILDKCGVTQDTQDKSFEYKEYLYIFIYHENGYYKVKSSDLQKVADNSSVNCENNEQFIINYRVGKTQQLIIRKDFIQVNSKSQNKPDKSDILNKEVDNFSENNSQCITYKLSNQSYIYWEGQQYQLPDENYSYYLIDKSLLLFYNMGKDNSIICTFEFDKTNYKAKQKNKLIIGSGGIFSQVFSIDGNNQQFIAASLDDNRLKLYDAASLQLQKTNGEFQQLSKNANYNSILTYGSFLIVEDQGYGLSYKNGNIQIEKRDIKDKNSYKLPSTDKLYRRLFQAAKSQILQKSENYYYLTMDSIVCDQDQYLNASNQCLQCGSNQIFKDNQCQDCQKQFFKKNNTCYSCSENCSVCQESQSCKECNVGFYLDQNQSKCLKCLNNCNLCSDSKTCNECKEGFEFKDNQCIECIAQPGQFFDPNVKKCVQCDNYCETCLTSNQCKGCKQGYALDTKNTCQIQQQCSQNCQSCNPQSYCLKCNDGYYLDKSNMCQQQQCDQNCQKCEQSSKKCLNCQSGYFLDSNKCQDFCVQCSDAKSCSQCTSGYNLFGTECIICEQKSGYFLDQTNNQCSKCDSNCQTCIISPKKCQSCQARYYLDKSNQCIQCMMNCTECTDSLTCKLCNQGFLHKENQCVDCSSQQGYIQDSNNQCVQCDPYCDKCLTSTKCEVCIKGYNLNNVIKIKSVAKIAKNVIKGSAINAQMVIFQIIIKSAKNVIFIVLIAKIKAYAQDALRVLNQTLKAFVFHAIQVIFMRILPNHVLNVLKICKKQTTVWFVQQDII
ncbi:hypothetical protein TTHERM_00100060 (macronuclear) [Tetrahymena thermophila SB210]|uniref:EGF-like domain-containing protein n=1 Tax=Tetrahymena thermophila (strain SB210) TaxID=312017 RepID=Q234U4_TETTS|nr:hypothetical protein TTHERM_00100060 [Tetrahymena thermophila SB210]EAR91909.2 hypothetical protein TTHERM_00100060 [Tetrahymena thermophila SB210]|eukprot:XP_001012154.2 hypothetical protein TTHERM_00100060 [Tetrahymena thermophila SB210]